MMLIELLSQSFIRAGQYKTYRIACSLPLGAKFGLGERISLDKTDWWEIFKGWRVFCFFLVPYCSC